MYKTRQKYFDNAQTRPLSDWAPSISPPRFRHAFCWFVGEFHFSLCDHDVLQRNQLPRQFCSRSAVGRKISPRFFLINAGVPQGSVLRRLHCLFYIHAKKHHQKCQKNGREMDMRYKKTYLLLGKNQGYKLLIYEQVPKIVKTTMGWDISKHLSNVYNTWWRPVVRKSFSHSKINLEKWMICDKILSGSLKKSMNASQTTSHMYQLYTHEMYRVLNKGTSIILGSR